VSFKAVAAQLRMGALAYPCEFPEQCSRHRYFAQVAPAQGVLCTVGLTVNVGEE